MIVALAGCLLAQRPTGARPAAEESDDIRIARLETTVPQMQKQLDEVNSQLKDVNKTLTELQRKTAEIRTDMKLIMWIGGVVGAFLTLNTFRPIFEKRAPPASVQG